MTGASYFVYWIQSGPRAYIGATVDPRKRLRQHNGELVGGAARTRNRGPWSFERVVGGFATWQQALQYEWAAKYHSRRCRGVAARRAALDALNTRERWTSNSPLAKDVPLWVEDRPERFGAPPANYEATSRVPPVRKRVPKKRTTTPSSVTGRRFVKRLHRVNY